MSKVRTNIEIEDVHVQAIMDRLNVRTKGGRPGPAALGWATHDPPGSAPNAGGPRHRRHAGRPCASRDPVILADTSTPQSPSTVDAVGLESPRAGRSIAWSPLSRGAEEPRFLLTTLIWIGLPELWGSIWTRLRCAQDRDHGQGPAR